MKIYNAICDNAKQKYALMRYYAETDDVKVVNVSGYYDGFIIHIEIAETVNVETVEMVTENIINKLA